MGRSQTLQYLRDRYIGNDPEAIADLKRFQADADIASAIYDMRTKAGLTHRQLAKKIGAAPSDIRQLEDADYEGPSLAMLHRIAEVLGSRVEIRVIPLRKSRKPGSGRAA